MTRINHYFTALLGNINPSEGRSNLAADLPGKVRDWLKDHDFKTRDPHTRLSGSYRRKTAILDINDVDVLLFLPDTELDRTPNAVLLDVKKVLDDYPAATAEVSGQRRSVHLKFSDPEMHLDIVPCVAEQGIDNPLKVPDRPAKEWIDSDPLGYAKRLSNLNQENGGKVVRLVKLVKAWRDVHMKTRRPKSYVLEVMVLYAIEGGHFSTENRSLEGVTADFFAYISDKYDDLMENGKEAPRIKDPQVDKFFITRSWERSHFETFMGRIREAEKASRRAVEAEEDDEKCGEWEKVFGHLWPSEDEAKEAAMLEATRIQPGIAKVSSSGLVGASTGITPQKTRFHGES